MVRGNFAALPVIVQHTEGTLTAIIRQSAHRIRQGSVAWKAPMKTTRRVLKRVVPGWREACIIGIFEMVTFSFWMPDIIYLFPLLVIRMVWLLVVNAVCSIAKRGPMAHAAA